MILKPLHVFRFEHRWHASSDSKRDRPYVSNGLRTPDAYFRDLKAPDALRLRVRT